MNVVHTIAPVFSPDSRVLILGSFPSPKSREVGFYYGHPQNRFWRVMAAVLGERVPETVHEKRELLLSHGIALWDVIAECEIVNASDASIRQVKPNDIASLIKKTQIETVFTNGAKANDLYVKLIQHSTGIKAIPLPSTSPANASYSLDRLINEYRIINDCSGATNDAL